MRIGRAIGTITLAGIAIAVWAMVIVAEWIGAGE
jgi:hypothetical protein